MLHAYLLVQVADPFFEFGLDCLILRKQMMMRCAIKQKPNRIKSANAKEHRYRFVGGG